MAPALQHMRAGWRREGVRFQDTINKRSGRISVSTRRARAAALPPDACRIMQGGAFDLAALPGLLQIGPN